MNPPPLISNTDLSRTALAGQVAVVNPAPGGGASNPSSFTIYPYALYLPMAVK